MENDSTFDTANIHGVAVRGDNVLLLNPPRIMNEQQALSLVAWVSVMAGLSDEQIAMAIQAVKST